MNIFSISEYILLKENHNDFHSLFKGNKRIQNKIDNDSYIVSTKKENYYCLDKMILRNPIVETLVW